MSDIFLIPKSFPCEKCGVDIIVGNPKYHFFICIVCGFPQRLEYFGKFFGLIKNVG